ncbi:hypothetical protein CORC01_06295 [Colletotrichum orchidophilum]|uniref:Uncharacterized protein n=1 Tax=Colletotrichum orchidophilum TaxID=1209926 RepID=A0A1G4BA65_9PEZI|nr:uncharacterized protein CORC01_06295 [Colletotrichum orchidophilum]OHE98299.1 hypothetical protein CORC01_06295 [Colletotrichum orchidophilum]
MFSTKLNAEISRNSPWVTTSTLIIAFISCMVAVKRLLYRRKIRIESLFIKGGRELSSVTVKESHDIITQLQQLEFSYAFCRARRLALLKDAGPPLMSKSFAITGHNNERKAGKRSVDPLREFQFKARYSDRYARSVARMDFLCLTKR